MAISRIVRVMTMAAVAMTATGQVLTNDAREMYLMTAKIVRTKGLSMGVTNSVKASMDDGTLQHDAHIQTIDEFKARFDGTQGTEMNFRDSYKYNVAAYRIAKLLNLDMVPPSVERKIGGRSSAVTWWVDDVMMTELDRHKSKHQPPDQNAWNKQMATVQVFDQLILNVDRNLGNLVITKDWNIWMIDHTRSFRLHKSCPKLGGMRQIDENLLDSLKKLNKAELKSEVGQYLSNVEIDSLLARRDAIVKHFEGRLAQNGPSAVLYQMARRKSVPASSTWVAQLCRKVCVG
jgi:hypothetical protein